MSKQYFTVKPEHIKLLRAANVGWDGNEFGAPAIDCKRPYGNSDVLADIAKIFDYVPLADGDFTDEQVEFMCRHHRETRTVLQIFLVTGQMKAGVYEADKYDRNWRFSKNGE